MNSFARAKTRKRTMQISELAQEKHYYTVIMRILGKAGLRPQVASTSCHSISLSSPHLSPTLPHLSFNPPFLSFIGSVHTVHSCCTASQDVIHFNDLEQNSMSLLAQFSSFAMTHSQYPPFMCKHICVYPLTLPHIIYILS